MTDDIARLIGAVTREVKDDMRNGKATKVVVALRHYDTGIDDLWDAITNPERLPRWFSRVSGEFALGGKYHIEGNASGTITRCEPPRELALTWEFAGGVSWVEVTLQEDGERTQLQLRHIAHPEEHWDKFGPGAVGVGWELGLMGLDRHIADPGMLKPPEADESWYTTAEAKRFVRLCAAGWGQADLAGGGDHGHALESAERTRKFYTGET